MTPDPDSFYDLMDAEEKAELDGIDGDLAPRIN